jgi:AcrR family transcriptional regulator
MAFMSTGQEAVGHEEPLAGGELPGGGELPAGEGAGRPLRKDAERNRQRILKAAAAVFTEQGLEATLDDVARHAGVGVATVYRRFPDKAALADALFEERIDTLAALATEAHEAEDPWEGLVSFMLTATEMLTTDKGLRQLLMFASHGHERVGYARDRMRPAIGKLVERAQAAGQVRPDLGATDIPVLEFMLGATAEYARDVRPDIWRRYLTLLLDALRPARTTWTPLPVPELSLDELTTAMRTSPLSPHSGGARPAQPGPGASAGPSAHDGPA